MPHVVLELHTLYIYTVPVLEKNRPRSCGSVIVILFEVIMPLDTQATSKIRGIIDNACADPYTDIPGTTIVIVDRNGEIFSHSSGTRGLGTKEPMTLDNVFWIASCTKMLTGIACMQLVEQGRLNLDDGEHLENLLPELKKMKVLKPDGSFEEKKDLITLRMLLTHTAGFGYTFFHERLRDWTLPAGVDEFSGRIEDIASLPLLFQPGEGWEYGVSGRWSLRKSLLICTDWY